MGLDGRVVRIHGRGGCGAFEGPERPRAFAFWGVVVGAAVAIGPLLGGIITSTVGWRWASLVNVPVGVALIALGSTSLDESRDVNAQCLDRAPGT